MVDEADLAEDAHGVRFSGQLILSHLGDIPERLKHLHMQPQHIDIAEVERLDTVGAWIIHRLSCGSGATVTGASAAASHLLAQVAAADHPVEMCPKPVHPISRILADIGSFTASGIGTLIGLVGFLGAIIIAIYNILSSPARFRWHAVVQCFDNVGVKALGIIGLMSFMIGLVIAEQGSTQLAANGLEIYTINLIGHLSIRDLGILMTAIMVAGRSGSAFAAQIGTMKLTEEIDAMRIIGISPIEALVLPRVIACTFVMPLLGFYSSILAIVAGGLFCWASLHIPPITFVERFREVVPLTDLWVGLIKAPVFGLIVAMTGCFQGMLVEADAEQVGLKTTAAVVQAIFLVIVLDAFFDVFFTQIGWG